MHNKLFLCFLLILGFWSCTDNDDTSAPNSGKEIFTFSFKAEDNAALTEDIIATIDQGEKIIFAEFPFGTDMTNLKPEITWSDTASLDPGTGVSLDFSKSLAYTVTAEDGSTNTYITNMVPGKANSKQILSFTFLVQDNPLLTENVTASIDQENKTISAELRFGISLDALTPTIEVSQNANVNPPSKTEINFSSPMVFTVTAEDGSTEDYTVNVTNRPISDRDVLILWYIANPDNTLSWDFSKEIEEWEGVTIENGRVTNVSLQDKGMPVVTPFIRFLDELRILRLVDNGITNLPKEVGELKNLVSLDLTHNELETLPAEIGNLSELKSIVLHNNKVKTLPAEIGNLKGLWELNLTFNDLISLPIEIGGLESLQSLSVYGSRQLSSIPSEIGNLTNLIDLNLGWCQLETIPDTIGDLTKLVTLRVDENGLKNVPTSFGNLVNLERLLLQKNALIELPRELGMLSSLFIIEIQENNITMIPTELCDLIALNDVIVNKDIGTNCE